MPPADLTLDAANALDAADELRLYRERFDLPADLVYLDGNSLGALPRGTAERLARVIRHEWGGGLVRSWNSFDWIDLPAKVGARIARLIGARPDEVVVADSTSVNLSRLALTALAMQPERSDIVSERGNFPTDLYACGGASDMFGRGRRLRLTSRERIIEAIDESTALVVLTHVHYKTGEIHDMAEITRAAHARGALVLWDLCHSVGALGVDLNGAGADFAVGCGYKYLNGGPGAPAFLFVAQRHHGRAKNAICGWMGHSRPFEFSDGYDAAPGIRRFLAGTPPVLATCALEVGVELTLEAGIDRISAKSRRLSDYFLALIDSWPRSHGLTCVSPRGAAARGSHVSFAHPHGYEIVQALIHESVVGDFRAPDVMRFGLTPLYTRFADVWIAADRLRRILEEERWLEPRFAVRAAVT
jgi:kynureninase